MKRHVIERDLPGIGSLNREKVKGAAATSNGALAALAGKAQWQHSYVVDDKTFCISPENHACNSPSSRGSISSRCMPLRWSA